MAKEPLVVAQITVTPIGTSRADITEYIRKCIRIAHLSEMNFQETPLGTVVRGPLGEVMKVIRKMHEAPFESGVRRVRTQVVIDDFREEDPNSPLKTARAARELAIDQETFDS
ncbi:MAG: MTH1187 family thiamine-binding protein [bacterium]